MQLLQWALEPHLNNYKTEAQARRPNPKKLNNDQAVGPGPNSEKNYTFQAAIG